MSSSGAGGGNSFAGSATHGDPPRRKVLQILYSGLGGHSAVAATLIEAGGTPDPWQHHLLFLGIEPVAPGYLDVCTRLDVGHHYVRAREGRPWAAWPELIRTIREISPNAIILHSIKAILPLRFAARGRPLVAVEHQQNLLKSRAEWIASAAAQRLADRVITLSPHYRTTLRRALGPIFSEKRTALVPTGIDLSAFDRSARSAEKQGIIRIGMAGRFTPQKAQEVLVGAIARLRGQRPETDWRLTLAGDGTCRAAVARLVRDEGLQDAIELPGHIAPDALPRWFGDLDVYAHASDGETLSTSLLQAMAAGVPIVASAAPGISDLLGPPTQGEAPLGRLVPPREEAAFAMAIADLAENSASAAHQAERARQHVSEHYSPQSMRTGYAEILDGLWHAK